MLGYVFLVLASCTALVTAALWYCIVFPRQPARGAPPPFSAAELALAARLEPHVRAIASRPHNLAHYPELEAAARYIESAIGELGLEARCQVYEVDGRSVRNIEIVFEPERIGAAEATYVVGAHYDSPDDSPGANDNGTGVAALLELARLLSGWKPRRHRLRLVFFVNEEQPYGKTPDMGSWRHAKQLHEEGERVAGMMALETLGYFSNEPGSQLFPPLRSHLPRYRELRRVRRLARVARFGAPGGARLPAPHELAGDRRCGAGLRAGHRPLRPLGLPAVRLPRADGHRHGAIPEPLLPHQRRPSSHGRLREPCPHHGGPGGNDERARPLSAGAGSTTLRSRT